MLFTFRVHTSQREVSASGGSFDRQIATSPIHQIFFALSQGVFFGGLEQAAEDASRGRDSSHTGASQALAQTHLNATRQGEGFVSIGNLPSGPSAAIARSLFCQSRQLPFRATACVRVPVSAES